ncbi:hypothetical protein, partial [Rhizobium leguminosarum]|uniref:hypothetical protein n=1 Tax=Rhizobium leguminosarum TaxID=384 RepID=UPI00197D9E81
QRLQQIAHNHGESSTIITVKTKLAPMGEYPMAAHQAKPRTSNACRPKAGSGFGITTCINPIRRDAL